MSYTPGPNVNAVDQDGLTALAIACKEGSTDIAFQLIAAGAYVNLQVSSFVDRSKCVISTGSFSKDVFSQGAEY